MTTELSVEQQTPAQTVIATVEGWEGVTSQPHRFGGIEFGAGGRELGHLHDDRLADLLLPKYAHDEAIAAGRAQPHHILPNSNWVSVYLHRPEQAEDVITLLRLAYERAVAHPVRRRSAQWNLKAAS
jgi:hypothetical protein